MNTRGQRKQHNIIQSQQEIKEKIEEIDNETFMQKISLEPEDSINKITTINFKLNQGIRKLTIQKNFTNEKNGFKVHKAKCKPMVMGLINSIKQGADNKLYDLLDMNIFIQQANQQSQNVPKFLRCKCNKSMCLKQYCDCFANGNMCTSQCQCQGCHNIEQYSNEREDAINKLKQQNQTQIENSVGISCKCKKSKCQKRYCDCFQNLQKCGDNCQCVGCENYEKIEPQFEQRLQSQFDENSRIPRSPISFRNNNNLFRRYDSMNYSNSFGFSRRNLIIPESPFFLKQDSQGFS